MNPHYEEAMSAPIRKEPEPTPQPKRDESMWAVLARCLDVLAAFLRWPV